VTVKPEHQEVSFEHDDFMVPSVRRQRACWFTPDQQSRRQTRFTLRKNSCHRLFCVAFGPAIVSGSPPGGVP
jgi:hypothetical protein